jgi:hypothetical protein
VFAIADDAARLLVAQDRETIVQELRTAIAEAVVELRADVPIGWLMPMARVSKASTEPGAEVTGFQNTTYFFQKTLTGCRNWVT